MFNKFSFIVVLAAHAFSPVYASYNVDEGRVDSGLKSHAKNMTFLEGYNPSENALADPLVAGSILLNMQALTVLMLA